MVSSTSAEFEVCRRQAMNTKRIAILKVAETLLLGDLVDYCFLELLREYEIRTKIMELLCF